MSFFTFGPSVIQTKLILFSRLLYDARANSRQFQTCIYSIAYLILITRRELITPWMTSEYPGRLLQFKLEYCHNMATYKSCGIEGELARRTTTEKMRKSMTYIHDHRWCQHWRQSEIPRCPEIISPLNIVSFCSISITYSSNVPVHVLYRRMQTLLPHLSEFDRDVAGATSLLPPPHHVVNDEPDWDWFLWHSEFHVIDDCRITISSWPYSYNPYRVSQPTTPLILFTLS